MSADKNFVFNGNTLLRRTHCFSAIPGFFSSWDLDVLSTAEAHASRSKFAFVVNVVGWCWELSKVSSDFFHGNIEQKHKTMLNARFIIQLQ